VIDTRGAIEGAAVAQWQVTMKVGLPSTGVC
jgi:flavin-binding protein dodecin